MNMSMDEKENLGAMMQSAGWEVFEKLMTQAYKNQEVRLMQYNLEDGPEKLVHEKARVEGAMRFMKAIMKYKHTIIRDLR